MRGSVRLDPTAYDKLFGPGLSAATMQFNNSKYMLDLLFEKMEFSGWDLLAASQTRTNPVKIAFAAIMASQPAPADA
jgi:hypothetical protein